MEAINSYYEELQPVLQGIEQRLLAGLERNELWPLAVLNADDLALLIRVSHRLAWECTAMRRRENMPAYVPYYSGCHYSADYAVQIVQLWQLLLLCDEQLIGEYRRLTVLEAEALRLLGLIHCAMIGHYYVQHPGLVTVAAHEVRFRH